MILHHYCCDHSAKAIQADGGTIRPQKTGLIQVSWFTDLAPPVREALGLTMHHTACNRTEHRFDVDDDSIVPWFSVRRDMGRDVRAALEQSPGAMPMHWWVSTAPIQTIDSMEGKQ